MLLPWYVKIINIESQFILTSVKVIAIRMQLDNNMDMMLK